MGCSTSTVSEEDPLSYLLSTDKWEGALNWLEDNHKEDDFVMRNDILSFSLVFYVNDEVHNKVILRLIELSSDKEVTPLRFRTKTWASGSSAISINLSKLAIDVYAKLIAFKRWPLHQIKAAYVGAMKEGSFQHVRLIAELDYFPLVYVLVWGIIALFPVEEVGILLDKVDREKQKERINFSLDNEIELYENRAYFSVGTTALMVSCSDYIDEVSCAILDAGADWTMTNAEGETAFEMCMKFGNVAAARYIINKTNTCRKGHRLEVKTMIRVRCKICMQEPKDCRFNTCQACGFNICHECFENKGKLVIHKEKNTEMGSPLKTVESRDAKDDVSEKRMHKKSVMISYNVKTCSKVAKSIRSSLDKSGVARPWMCEQDLKPGQDWRSTIGKVVMACDVFVMLINKEWLDSGECNDEYNIAKSRNIKTQRPLMIPIFVGKELADVEHEKVYSLKSNYNFLIFFDDGGIETLCESILGLL